MYKFKLALTSLVFLYFVILVFRERKQRSNYYHCNILHNPKFNTVYITNIRFNFTIITQYRYKYKILYEPINDETNNSFVYNYNEYINDNVITPMIYGLRENEFYKYQLLLEFEDLSSVISDVFVFETYKKPLIVISDEPNKLWFR